MPALSNNRTALEPLLSRLLRECLESSNSSIPAPARGDGSLEIVYVLLMVGLFGFFTAGVMVTNLRSRGSPELPEPPGGHRDRRHRRPEGICHVLENRPALERPPGPIPREKSP